MPKELMNLAASSRKRQEVAAGQSVYVMYVCIRIRNWPLPNWAFQCLFVMPCNDVGGLTADRFLALLLIE